MRVGTILLNKSNEYVNQNMELPKRPRNDKELLTGMCRGQIVSEEAYAKLPLSIQKVVMVGDEPTIPIGIKELDEAEILLVNRSTDTGGFGEEFRLDNFKYLGKVELWKKGI